MVTTRPAAHPVPRCVKRAPRAPWTWVGSVETRLLGMAMSSK
jgi:hypothetical protein